MLIAYKGKGANRCVYVVKQADEYDFVKEYFGPGSGRLREDYERVECSGDPPVVMVYGPPWSQGLEVD